MTDDATATAAGPGGAAGQDGDRPTPAVAEVPSPATPASGRTPDVRTDDPWAEAGRTILHFHLARMLARVPGVIAGEDPEEVHAMRVAARRMRAAWRVFGDGFEREERRRYRGELRDVGARLGAVRDLDVLIEIVVAYGAQRSARQRAGLEPLLSAWRAEREARRVDLVAELESERFAGFIADYSEFVETPGLAALPVAPHAPRLVRTGCRRRSGMHTRPSGHSTAISGRPTSPRCTSSGSRPSGCATRSSSSGSRSNRARRR